MVQSVCASNGACLLEILNIFQKIQQVHTTRRAKCLRQSRLLKCLRVLARLMIHACQKSYHFFRKCQQGYTTRRAKCLRQFGNQKCARVVARPIIHACQKSYHFFRKCQQGDTTRRAKGPMIRKYILIDRDLYK